MGNTKMQGFRTETDHISMKVEIRPDIEQIKMLVDGIITREVDIREVINKLEFKLKEIHKIELEDKKRREAIYNNVTEKDIYPNKPNSNFVGD